MMEKNNDQRAFHAETVAEQEAAGVGTSDASAQRDEREAFEAWVIASGRGHLLGRDETHGWYADLTVTAWWSAWMARAGQIGAKNDDREERHSMQLAGISTAAIGYWKEGDSVHPDYDTTALRDVAKLYAKYAELSTRQVQADPLLAECVEALREVLDAREREAKAEQSYRVAEENFASAGKELNQWVAATTAASSAENAARLLLAKVQPNAPKPRQLHPTDPCNGMNCGCTDGVSHSPECMAETAATYAGGWFVKASETMSADKIREIASKYGMFMTVGEYDITKYECEEDFLNCVREILSAAAPQPAPATGDEREALQIFKDHLNDLRDLDVSAAFHKIVALASALQFNASAAHRREDQRDSARYSDDLAKALGMGVGSIGGKRVGFAWDYLLGIVEDMVAYYEREEKRIAMQRTAAPAQTDTKP